MDVTEKGTHNSTAPPFFFLLTSSYLQCGFPCNPTTVWWMTNTVTQKRNLGRAAAHMQQPHPLLFPATPFAFRNIKKSDQTNQYLLLRTAGFQTSRYGM